jgi:hypothetical protein
MGGVSNEYASPFVPIPIRSAIDNVVLKEGIVGRRGKQFGNGLSPASKLIAYPSSLIFNAEILGRVDSRPPIHAMIA